jgi:hypothetical protein
VIPVLGGAGPVGVNLVQSLGIALGLFAYGLLVVVGWLWCGGPPATQAS